MVAAQQRRLGLGTRDIRVPHQRAIGEDPHRPGAVAQCRDVGRHRIGGGEFGCWIEHLVSVALRPLAATGRGHYNPCHAPSDASRPRRCCRAAGLARRVHRRNPARTNQQVDAASNRRFDRSGTCPYCREAIRSRTWNTVGGALTFTSRSSPNTERGRDLDVNSNELPNVGFQLRSGASTALVATALRELHDRFQASAMPCEPVWEWSGRGPPWRAANALKIPTGTLGMKLEKQKFGFVPCRHQCPKNDTPERRQNCVWR